MAKTMMSLEKLSGPEGLLTALLVQAVRDATSKASGPKARRYRKEARRWLGSADYQAVLTALGLPPDLLPIALEPVGVAVGD